MMSLRSATPRRMLVALIGRGRGVPASEITRNGMLWLRLSGFVRKKLLEARGPGVEQAEAVTALSDLEERLRPAFDEEHVAEDAVGVERVECEQAGGGVEQLVAEDERDVPLREARQVQPRGLVAGVVPVEDHGRPDQALVGVLGGVVDAVVVVPQEAERLLHVAVGRIRRSSTPRSACCGSCRSTARGRRTAVPSDRTARRGLEGAGLARPAG